MARKDAPSFQFAQTPAQTAGPLQGDAQRNCSHAGGCVFCLAEFEAPTGIAVRLGIRVPIVFGCLLPPNFTGKWLVFLYE